MLGDESSALTKHGVAPQQSKMQEISKNMCTHEPIMHEATQQARTYQLDFPPVKFTFFLRLAVSGRYDAFF